MQRVQCSSEPKMLSMWRALVLREGTSERGMPGLYFVVTTVSLRAQAWPQHKYFCHEPYQMGLYAAGQSKTVTPVFIPKSTGSIETLPRDKLSRMLSCAASDVEIVVSPISILFDPAHHIICAYNAGTGGLIHPRGPELGIAFSTAPGELCTHAVHITRSLVHSFGS
jgi:hypothetical protein